MSRIAEPPKWWLNGVPRYDEFRPDDTGVYADEALLVHIRCQNCGADYSIGLCGPRPHLSFRSLLMQVRELGIGDPPNGGCCEGIGATMGAVEVAVLEFWERKNLEWKRVPELERGLWTSDEERAQGHDEAWRRIRSYRSRRAGMLPAWTPLPHPPEFSSKLPDPTGHPRPEHYVPVDTPALNSRRRLLLLALSGRIDAAEFARLQNESQTTFWEYEGRPEGPRPAWAETYASELVAIDEDVIANAIAGWREMTEDERDRLYCHGLNRKLFELARSGRMGQEERYELFRLLSPDRYA